MKRVLDWIKANPTLLACVVVIVVVAPAIFFFGKSRAAGFAAAHADEAKKVQGSLDRLQVEYRVESVSPTEPGVSFRRVPNEATTEAMRARIMLQRDAVEELRTVAIARGTREGLLLVEGLFPEPLEEEASAKRQRAAAVWPQAHVALLRNAEAGPPPNPEMILDKVEGQYLQLKGDAAVAVDEELSLEESQRIAARLGEVRLDEYKRRAGRLTFYADKDAFASVKEGVVAFPSLTQAWDWQVRHWTHAAVVSALARANTDAASGRPLRVPEAPVKRLLRLHAPPSKLVKGTAGERNAGGRNTSRQDGGGAVSGPPLQRTAPLQPNFNASISGRTAWPEQVANQLYDIRYAEVSLVVESRSLSRVLGAINREAYVNVVGATVVAYDSMPDLKLGYYYGPGGVVRLDLRLETLWLRDWTAPLMPPAVRAAMGVSPELVPQPDNATESAEQPS